MGDIKALSDLGLGMEESAIKALEKSSRWVPAILYNEPVNALRIQPFILTVSAAGEK